MSPYKLQKISDAVYIVDAPQRFFGVEVGARMTVLKLDGDLLIHSPIAMDPAAVAHLGTPRWVLAPNLFHHLYVGPWVDAGLGAWAARGLPDKRSDLCFDGIIEFGARPFGEDVWLLPLTCVPFSNEVVVLHRPSRTLIVSDLVFNISPTAPWLTRASMRCLCGYPGCKTTLLERIGIRRKAARRELSVLAEWDFDRVIMAHGDVIESGGKRQLLNAFRWL